MRKRDPWDRFLRFVILQLVLLWVFCLVIPVIWWPTKFVPRDYGPLALAAAILITYLLGTWRPGYLAVWLSVYVAVYAVLSWHGDYLYGNFGGSDNRFVWYPAYCGESYRPLLGRTKCRLQPAGWFFLPLIVLDRLTIHPTQYEWEKPWRSTGETGSRPLREPKGDVNQGR